MRIKRILLETALYIENQDKVNSYLKTVSDATERPMNDLESIWHDAELIAREEGKIEDFEHIKTLFKSLAGINDSLSEEMIRENQCCDTGIEGDENIQPKGSLPKGNVYHNKSISEMDAGSISGETPEHMIGKPVQPDKSDEGEQGITACKKQKKENINDYDDDDEEQYEHLPSIKIIEQNKALIVKTAQMIYDKWDENPDVYAGGGICHLIADAIVEVIYKLGVENVTTVSCDIGDIHVHTAVQTKEGVFIIDISPYTYETGGGYSWKKVPDVVFYPDDLTIYQASADPGDWKNYMEDF